MGRTELKSRTTNLRAHGVCNSISCLKRSRFSQGEAWGWPLHRHGSRGKACSSPCSKPESLPGVGVLRRTSLPGSGYAAAHTAALQRGGPRGRRGRPAIVVSGQLRQRAIARLAPLGHLEFACEVMHRQLFLLSSDACGPRRRFLAKHSSIK
jgi:hypothetical protein